MKRNNKLIENVTKSLLEKKRVILNKLKLGYIEEQGDEVDEMQSNLINYMENQISSRDKYSIYLIDSALNKIKTGSFGSCEECGEDISEKRLLYVPEAVMCIFCAEAFENNQRQKG